MTRALVALVALVLASPAGAVAQAPQTNAPPGNSAIDEYLETVPGAAGNTRPRPPGRSESDSTLTPVQRARLERLGPDGRTLANAVEKTSPAPPPKREMAAPRRKSETAAPEPKSETAAPEPKSELVVPKSDGRSPVGQVVGTFSGSDGGSGMGLVLPAILIGALLAVLLLVVLRRRAAS